MNINQFSGTLTNQTNKLKKAAIVVSAVIPTACGNITTHSPVAPSNIAPAVDTAFGEFVGHIYSKVGKAWETLSITTVKTENSQFVFFPIDGPAAGVSADLGKMAGAKRYYQDISPKYTKTIGNFFNEARNGNYVMADTSSNTIRRWFKSVENRNMYVQSVRNPENVSCVRVIEESIPSIVSKRIDNDKMPVVGHAAEALLPRDSVTQDYIDGVHTPSKKYIFDFCKDSKGHDIDAKGNEIIIDYSF